MHIHTLKPVTLRKYLLAPVLALLLLPASAAWSQDQPSEEAETLKTREIVVTPTRTERDLQEVPSSVSVISSDDLKKSGADNIADALRDVPGLEVFDQSIPGAKRVQIRGESGSRVLVLIDGQKISEQKSMDGAPLLIDPNRIERIEVIKGPASVLYGSEAIGGVVNIITKKGGQRPVQVEMSASYDTSAEGTIGYASAFGAYQGFQYRFSGTWTDYDDREAPDGKVENTSYDIQDYSAFLGYERDKLSVGATYDNYEGDFDSHTPEGTTGDTLTYFQLDLPEWNREKFGSYVEVRDIASFLPRIRLDAYYQNTTKLFKNDMDLNVPMGFWGNMLIQNRIVTENDQDTIGGNFQTDWQPHPNHYLILGFEAASDHLDASSETSSFVDSPMPPPFGSQTTTVTKYNYEAELDTQALYLQDEWTLPADFTATLGVRQTWVSSELKDTDDPSLDKRNTDDAHPVFSAGLTYQGVDNLVLRGLFSQGYRFPNLQQLFIGTTHGSSEPTYPNPDLAPETSNNYEIGARFDNGALSLDVAGFLSQAEDYISTEPVTGGRRFANVDQAETYGAEATISYTFTDLGLTPYASGTWIRREYKTDTFTTADTGQPEFWGRFGLRYEQDLWADNVRFLSDLYVRAASEAEEKYSNGTKDTYGSWETLNLMLGARFGREQQHFVTLNLNNLFDRSYTPAQSTVEEPGFHAVIKAGVSF